VLPEGYGLVGDATETSYYEALLPETRVACVEGTQIDYPIQYALACAARNNSIAIASNVFVTLPNGTRRITEIVYGVDGTTIALYHKHHLFPPGEPKLFTPG
jgi:apolipoprotein N-acyltransferase